MKAITHFNLVGVTVKKGHQCFCLH